MKLDPDCIRDILLTAEDKTGYGDLFQLPEDLSSCPKLEKYTEDEVMYHLRQCIYSNLLICGKEDLAGNIQIHDLHPKGHEFIANIRKDNIWGDVKAVCGKVGSTSLTAITQIASAVVTEIIKAQLNLLN